MHKLDELLLHSGVKGMHWGVRRERKRTGKGRKPKHHKSLMKSGRDTLRKFRKLEARLDFDHIDAKTGEYTHQSKTAKTLRVVDRVLDVAGGITLAALNSIT